MGRKDFKLVGEHEIAARLKPGRNLCNCQARIHGLVLNCLSCGRIVCQQEGSGPCIYCGNLVCTKEEREILDKRDGKSLDLLRKLFNRPELQDFKILETSSLGIGGEANERPFSLSSIAQSLQTADSYKQKLLIADKDQEITKVNDLQADYFSLELNPYLTGSEREAIVRRKEELRQLSLQEKRNILVDVDISSGAVAEQRKATKIETVDDPVLQAILTNSMARQTHLKAAVDPRSALADEQMVGNEEEDELIHRYIPQYQEWASRSAVTPEQVFASHSAEFKALLSSKNSRDGNKLLCIGLRKQLADELANSQISYLPWNQFVDHQGPILIAALADDFPSTLLGASYPQTNENGNSTGRGSIVGRARLRECLSREEFANETPKEELSERKLSWWIPKSANNSKSAPFVLIFDAQEPLISPVPCACPSEWFELDGRRMRDAINANLITAGDGGIFDSLATVPAVME